MKRTIDENAKHLFQNKLRKFTEKSQGNPRQVLNALECRECVPVQIEKELFCFNVLVLEAVNLEHF